MMISLESSTLTNVLVWHRPPSRGSATLPAWRATPTQMSEMFWDLLVHEIHGDRRTGIGKDSLWRGGRKEPVGSVGKDHDPVTKKRAFLSQALAYSRCTAS